MSTSHPDMILRLAQTFTFGSNITPHINFGSGTDSWLRHLQLAHIIYTNNYPSRLQV